MSKDITKTPNGTKFRLTNNWRDENQAGGIFTVKSVEIPKNKIVCLVGCNGIGKTTTLEEIKQFLESSGVQDVADTDEYNAIAGVFRSLSNKKEKKPVGYLISFDKEAKFVLEKKKSWFDEMGLGQMWMSNGESVVSRLNGAFQAITIFAKKAVAKQVPFWLLIDDVDAGTSIDVISEVKASLVDLSNYLNKNNLEHYIVVTSNSFEFAKDMYCLYARTMKKVEVTDYEKYKKFVLKSRKDKEKRDGIHTNAQ